MRAWSLLVGATFIACVSDSTGTIDSGTDTSTPPIDAAPDTSKDAVVDAPPPPPCDLGKPFGAPVAVTGLNTTDWERSARLSHDELTVYIDRFPIPSFGWNLLVATRTSTLSAFGPLSEAPFSNINSTFLEINPTVSADGLTLFFVSDRVNGKNDIFVATRTSILAPFNAPAPTSTLNQAAFFENDPYALPDALTVYFGSDRTGTGDIFRATRTTSTAFVIDASGALSSINTPTIEGAPAVTTDEKTIYFAANRTDGGAKGDYDIWVATRASASSPFGNPTNVSELNSPKGDVPSWISDDGCRLYLTSDRGTSYDIYLAIKPK